MQNFPFVNPDRVKLFIAGSSPNSARACRNLKVIAEQLAWAPERLAIVEALKDLPGAIEAGVKVLPTLLLQHEHGATWISGDLADLLQMSQDMGSTEQQWADLSADRLPQADLDALTQARAGLFAAGQGGWDAVIDPLRPEVVWLPVAGVGLLHDADARARGSQLQLDDAERELVLDASDLGFFEYRPQEDRFVWSAAFQRIVFPMVDKEGIDSLLETVVPTDRALVTGATEAALVGGTLDVECRVGRPDGGEAWIRLRGRTILETDLRPLRLVGSVTDMTSHREALRVKSQLAAIVESSDDAIVGQDLSGTITSWNEGAARLFGYPAHERLGQPFALLFLTSRQHELTRLLALVEEGTPARKVRTEGLTSDQKVLQLTLNLTPIRDETGAVVGAACTARDISERRRIEAALRRAHDELELRVEQRTADLDRVNANLREELGERHAAEAALRQSELKFRSLVQSAHEAIAICDSNGSVIDNNRAVETIFGFKAHEMVGRPISRLLTAAGYLIAQTEFSRLFADADPESGHRVLEVDGVRRDGTAFPMELSLATWHANGGAFFSAIFRDISRRKQVEAEIRARVSQQEAVAELGQRALAGAGLAVLLQSAVGLVRSGLEVQCCLLLQPTSVPGLFEVTHSSPEAVATAAATKSASKLHTTVANLTAASPEPVILPDLSKVEGASPSGSHDTSDAVLGSVIAMAVRVEGEVHSVLLAQSDNLNRFVATDGLMLQAIANLLSAAVQRDRSQRTLEAAREEAERANNAKSEFLSRMSHELRTPLNAILGFGQLLEMEELSELQVESVGHIMKAGRHLLDLVNEVLDITRAETGRLELSYEPVEVNEVVQEALSLVRNQATAAGITLDAQILTTHPHACVCGDHRGLKQILLNLLNNGVKYNRPQGKVVVRGIELSERRFRIEVQDEGHGISVDDAERLFVPFERLSAGRTNIEGTGLGLALSRRLAECMDAVLGIESEVGIGSVFFLELNLVPSPDRTQPVTAGPIP